MCPRHGRMECLAAVALAALLTCSAFAAPAAHAQTSSQIDQAGQPATDWPPQDWLGRTLQLPTKWLVDALTGSLVAIGQTLLEAIRKDVDWAFGKDGKGTNFVTQTPPSSSYQSPSVRPLFDTMRVVANLALGLVVMWTGFHVMSGPSGRSSMHSVMELVPRLVVGAVLVNTSLWWAQLAIDAGNALGSVAGPIELPGRSAATDVPMILELVLTGLVFWVVALLLVLQQLMRLALVDALLVLAPLGMLLWILPQTQAWGRVWSDLFLTTVFAQPVQMLVLKLGALLIGELAGGGPLVSMFLAMGVAYLTLKLPGMLRGGLVRGGGQGTGLLPALVATRQLGRSVTSSR